MPRAPASGRWALPILVILVACATVLTNPALGDEEIDRLVAAAKGAGDRHLDDLLARLAREPDNAYLYRTAGEQLYNLGRREQALALLEAGVRKASDPARVVEVLRAVYRHELDLDRLEKSFAEELDAAIARRDEHLPAALLLDAVMTRRLLPRYLEQFRKAPEYDGLLQFLRQAAREPAARISVLEARLSGVPTDQAAAHELMYQYFEARRYELLAGGEGKLPEAVRKYQQYPVVRAKALLALGRTDQALQAAAEAEKTLREYRWNAYGLAEVYRAAGRKDKAVEVLTRHAPAEAHETALALAACGAKKETLACVEKVVNRDAPAWVLYECADALRTVEDEEHAEEVLQAGEAKCLRELARSRNPLFDMPFQIRYWYEKQGLQQRFVDAFAPLGKGNPSAAADLFGVMLKPNDPQGLDMMKRSYNAWSDNVGFVLLFAAVLEQHGDFRRAREMYARAEKLPRADDLRLRPPATTDTALGQFRCFLAMKDYDACEAWLKTLPDPAAVSYLAILYRQAGRTEQAVEAYRKLGDHQAAVGLLLATAGPDAAEAYLRGIADESERARLRELISQRRPATAPQTAPTSLPADAAPAARAAWGVQLIRAGQTDRGREQVRQAVRGGCDFHLLGPLVVGERSIASLPTGITYRELLAAYLDAALKDELEKDVAPLLDRTSAHRARHLEALADWYASKNLFPAAREIYDRLLTLDPYRAASYADRLKAMEPASQPAPASAPADDFHVDPP